MNRESVLTGGAVGEQGGLLAEIITRIVQAPRRVAVFEGNDPDEREPLPEAIAGLQRFVDETHPGAAHLREQFWNELEGDVDALHLRLDRVVKINASIRRQGFTVIEGGRHD
jgi:hypothetical protein